MTNKQSGMCPAEPVRHVPGSYTDSALLQNLCTARAIMKRLEPRGRPVG